MLNRPACTVAANVTRWATAHAATPLRDWAMRKIAWNPFTVLDERSLKSPEELDFGRYAGWATGLVRKPAGDTKTAIRVVGLLRLESERKYLVALASAANSTVREAAAQALERLKGWK